MHLQALTLAALATLDPVEAAHAAAAIAGRPDLADDLVRVCMRESRCERVGIHARDAWLSASSWGGQVQLGHLDPDCQPRGRGWATRGAWGLNAAAHWPYLPACYPAAVLDVPIVSAMVAVRKLIRHCEGRRRVSWCPARRSRARPSPDGGPVGRRPPPWPAPLAVARAR